MNRKQIYVRWKTYVTENGKKKKRKKKTKRNETESHSRAFVQLYNFKCNPNLQTQWVRIVFASERSRSPDDRQTNEVN